MTGAFRSRFTARRWQRLALGALLLLACAVWLWMGWRTWLAPTRIALVNYPEFQASRLLKASPDAFHRITVLPLEHLQQAKNYDLILVFGRGLKLDEAQLQHLRAAAQAGTPLFVDGASNPQHDTLTNLQGEHLDAVSSYLHSGGPANYQRLQTYVRSAIDGKSFFTHAVQPAQEMPQDVFFHLGDDAVFTDLRSLEQHLQKQPGWQPQRPRLALLTSVPGPFNANRDHVDATIRALEARGFEVIPMAAVHQRLAFLQQVQPDAVVYMPHGRLTLGQADEARQWLVERNIPLFAPVSVFAQEQDWLADPRSFEGSLLTMSITLPELDGATTPMAIAAQFRDSTGLRVFRALPQRLERFADLVQRSVALKAKPNAEKKLAIYYYKGPGQSALTAGDLEVVPSLYALLQHLKAQGYRIDGLPATEAAFAQLLQQRGPNIGPYAKGDFAQFLQHADPALVSAAQLQQWCGQLIEQALCEQMHQQFGPAPGSYLSHQNHVAVARVPLGNVVLLPQPLPGVGDDTFKIVHGTKQAPPWPYVASYLWTREVFGADVVMHFGTHGSLEFTPGKQMALSDHDWPDALIGNVPHLYLYTMANVGEAMIAKRRSYATTVSHLTPPLRAAGAQSEYKQLADRLQAWSYADRGALRQQYARDIQPQAVALGLHQDLSLPADIPWTDAQLQQLADHMETVASAHITDGLYTLGTPYAASALDSTARLMGEDAILHALAVLDVARGTVERSQLQHTAWLAQTYRPQAQTLMDRAQQGVPAQQLLAQVLQPGELQRALDWERSQRSPSDDELVRSFIALGSQPAAAAPAAPTLDDAALRQHLARALADADQQEFLHSLRSEQKLKHALRALDPESLQTARSIAKAIPAMSKALDIATSANVLPLLQAMQSAEGRQKVLDWLADPTLQASVEEELRQAKLRAQQAWLAQAQQYQGALELATAISSAEMARQHVQRLDSADLAELDAALAFWQKTERPALEEWELHLQNAVKGLEHLRKALQKAEDQQQDSERRFAQTVLSLRARLQAIPDYREQLAISPARELNALSNALSGGFTAPSSGGDALVNPQALPTGRNLYSIDAEKTPSAQAWSVARQMVDQMLNQHRAAHDGQWPTKVAFTLWAGDFIHTEGTSVAQILYLLGVEPVRDAFGRVSSLRLIEREVLGRPRIDVVVQTSGQLRDLAASRLYLINQAVAMAAQAREADNAVAQGVQAVERALKERGAAPAQARKLAHVRVFGGVNGNYGSGIMDMVEAGDRWKDRSEVAQTYLSNMGATYGEGDLWGDFQAGAFEAALAGTQLVVQPLESNTWGPISLDHVYEFMGGLNLAVREVTGAEPDAYFSDYRSPSRPAMREAKAAIAVEARATVLNPAYIQSLTQGGASSAENLAEITRNLYGWNVMKSEAIAPEMWDALHDTYVRDRHQLGVQAFFERVNPYALQEMTAVMLETARKGYWLPSDERLQELTALHADLVSRFGASGTGFVNDNAALRSFIAQHLGDAAMRQSYQDALQTSNAGAVVNTEKALVLQKANDGSLGQPAQAASSSDSAQPQPRQPALQDQPTLNLRPNGSLLGVLIAAVLALGALVWWLRRRHAEGQA